jgi:hypothetical protein
MDDDEEVIETKDGDQKDGVSVEYSLAEEQHRGGS